MDNITKEQYSEAKRIIRIYEAQIKVEKAVKSFTNECTLNRLPNNCTIIQNTSFKTCEGCGHKKTKDD